MASSRAVRNFAVCAVVAGASAMLCPGPGRADSKRGLNQDQVLEAVTRGEIRPLAEVLAAAERSVPGRVIRIEVERKRGRIVYELKIIAEGGRVRELYIDAATLEVLKAE